MDEPFDMEDWVERMVMGHKTEQAELDTNDTLDRNV